VLAGILIKVGIDIIDWQYLRRVHTAPRSGVFFMVVVLLLTVFVDLITAVAVGVVMASLLFVKRMSDLQLASITTVTDPTEGSMLDAEENAALEAVNGDVVLEHLRGPFSFGAAKDMARLLGAADYYKALIIDMTDVTMLDSSASLAVEDVIRGVQARDKQVLVAGARPQVRRVLDKLGVSALIPPSHMCGTRLEALQEAVRLLEKSSEGE
jgi:SulP family sulfate permease